MLFKLRFVPTIVATLIYLMVLWVSFEDEAASDGFTRFGFPFCFYSNSGGKFLPGYRPAFGFNPLNFVLDFLILALIIMVANYLYVRYINRALQG